MPSIPPSRYTLSQLVCAYHAGKTQYSTALKICNQVASSFLYITNILIFTKHKNHTKVWQQLSLQSKNRSTDLLPTDSHRVFLSPGSEDEGSDYINASWLTGDNDGNVDYEDDNDDSYRVRLPKPMHASGLGNLANDDWDGLDDDTYGESCRKEMHLI